MTNLLSMDGFETCSSAGDVGIPLVSPACVICIWVELRMVTIASISWTTSAGMLMTPISLQQTTYSTASVYKT